MVGNKLFGKASLWLFKGVFRQGVRLLFKNKFTSLFSQLKTNGRKGNILIQIMIFMCATRIIFKPLTYIIMILTSRGKWIKNPHLFCLIAISDHMKCVFRKVWARGTVWSMNYLPTMKKRVIGEAIPPHMPHKEI